jgi:hypothetical protein
MYNSKTSTRPGDSFVDDTTTWVKSDDTEREPVPLDEKDLMTNKTELIEHMQVAIQYVLDLLQVTGGDLAPDKYCGTLSCTGEKKVFHDY